MALRSIDDQKSRRNKRLGSDMTELLPYKGLTKGKDAFIILKEKDDGFAELLSIRGQNVWTMSGDGQASVIEGFQRFLRTYLEDFKVVIMPFPANTTTQREFTSTLYTKVANQIRQEKNGRKKHMLQTRLRYINDALHTNERVEKELDNKEFILILFGKTVRQLRTNREQAKIWGGNALILEDLTRENKMEVLARLNNMNTRNI